MYLVFSVWWSECKLLKILIDFGCVNVNISEIADLLEHFMHKHLLVSESESIRCVAALLTVDIKKSIVTLHWCDRKAKEACYNQDMQNTTSGKDNILNFEADEPQQ